MNELLKMLKIACSSGGYDLEIAIRDFVMSGNDVSKTYEIVLRQAFKYLVLFEKDHPKIHYPRLLLGQIQNRAEIDYSQFENRKKFETSYYDVGANMFDSSLDYLEDAYHAIRKNNDYKAKIQLSVALNSLIGAFLQRFWLIDSPETYEIWKHTATMAIDEETYSKVKIYRASSSFIAYQQSLCDTLIEEFSTLDM